MKLYSYSVEGHGPFPLDMLRYDQAWPESQEDVLIINSRVHWKHSIRRNASDPVIGPARVRLQCMGNPPSQDRWASFGWKVLEVRHTANVHS